MKMVLITFALFATGVASATDDSSDYYNQLKGIEKEKLVDIKKTSHNLKEIGESKDKFTQRELELYKLLTGHSKIMSGEYTVGQEILEDLSKEGTIADYTARSYSILALLYQMRNENVKAFLSIDKASSMLSRVKESEYRFGIIANTVSVYKSSDLLEFALDSARRLMTEASKVKTNKALCLAQFELAEIEHLAGKTDLAKQRFLVAKDYCEKAGDKAAIVMINNTLADIFVVNKEFLKAKEHLDKVFPLAEEYGWDILITYYYVRYGEAFLGMDKPKKALEFAKKASHLSSKSPDGKADELVASLMARVNAELGNKEEALKHYQKYMEINKKNDSKIRERKLAFDVARRGKIH